MPNITNTLSTINGEANNIPVEWEQHTSPPVPFNIKNAAGEAQDVSGYTFSVGASVSTVEYVNGKLTEVSQPLMPQPTFNPPTIADSPRLGQKYLMIPVDLYLEPVDYDVTTRPAVVTDVLYTNPQGETDLIRFTIIVFRAKGSN